jgi:hypothetical protein
MESQETTKERERCVAILGKVIGNGYSGNADQVVRAFKKIKSGAPAESFLLPGERKPPVEA